LHAFQFLFVLFIGRTLHTNVKMHHPHVNTASFDPHLSFTVAISFFPLPLNVECQDTHAMSPSPLFPLSAAPLNRLLPFLASPANSNENLHQKQPPFPIRRKHARIHSCVDYLCIYSLDGIYLAQKRRILLGEEAL
jgi:hypothetical protein